MNYDVAAVKSNVRIQEIFLKEGETVGIVNPETGASRLDSIEDERQFDATEVEQKITSPDSNQKILEEIKRHAVEHEQQYGRFPKTLIFATNDLLHTSHADQLVNTARDIFGRGDSFVEKILCQYVFRAADSGRQVVDWRREGRSRNCALKSEP